MPYKRFLGYERGEDGQMVINDEQAKLVRRIYKMCVDGLTPSLIAKQLTKEGIPTPGGCTRWQASVIESILTNEKYKGDALLQKTFCTAKAPFALPVLVAWLDVSSAVTVALCTEQRSGTAIPSTVK